MRKRGTALVALIAVLAAVLAGCNSAGTAAGGGAEAAKDTGLFTVNVADGWTAYDVPNVFGDAEGDIDTTALNIGKATESEADLFSHPYLSIKYYSPEITMFADTQDWYENVEELEPMTIGENTWTGFSGDSADVHWAILFTGESDGPQFQVSLTPGTQDDLSASLDDPDVQAMIASIVVDPLDEESSADTSSAAA